MAEFGEKRCVGSPTLVFRLGADPLDGPTCWYDVTLPLSWSGSMFSEALNAGRS